MANNAQNVSVGKPQAAGGIYSSDLTVDLPTDATSPLTDFDGLGFVSDEGLTNAIEMDTETIGSWGGLTVLTVRTSRTETFSWTFIETNALVLAEVYGQDNVTVGVDGELTILHNNAALPARQYIFEILMTGGRVKRIVVPLGTITEIGEVQYSDGEPIGYAVTLSTAPDKDGNTVIEYIAAIAGGDEG